MINALKEKDQKVALAASEFWSGIVSVKSKTEELKISTIRNILTVLLPCLLDCCRFTETDRLNMVPSKESDINTDDKDTKQITEDEEEEEDYEIGENENFTTLRKSSAFTLERFSSNTSFFIK